MAETLLEKLSQIQVELKAPKNQYNKFGNYKYRNCEDILEAVKPICYKNRTTLVIEDQLVVYGDRYYIKGIATLYDWDSEITIQTSALARESATKKGMDDSQITGATSSYARKYALNGLFNIDDTKDNDSEELKQQREGKEKEDKKSPKSTTKNSGTAVSKDAKEVKIAKIQQFYTTRKKSFGPVLTGFLEGRKVSELKEAELDGLLELIETSKESFMEDK